MKKILGKIVFAVAVTSIAALGADNSLASSSPRRKIDFFGDRGIAKNVARDDIETLLCVRLLLPRSRTSNF